MRITQNMMAATTLRNLNKNLERLDRLQEQLTSGQRVSAPSDDPIGTSTALAFRSTLAEVGQYLKNVDAANSWLEATDAALNGVGDVLQRARELAVQGSNDLISAQDRQAIAIELDRLIEQVAAVGNSTYANQFLFGGLKTDTSPYTLAGTPPSTVTYNGDGGQISRQIDRDDRLIVNVSGQTTLEPVFSSLIALRDDLLAGNSASVSSRLGDLDTATGTVLAARSEAGARINRLSHQKDRLERLKVNIAGLLSTTQDADMTATITDIATQQSVYQAALSASAKIMRPSLLDYLE